MKFRGIICEKCGVEVTKSNVRRERMGHINLATPVAHIWFLKSLPSRISLAIDMKLKEVEKVLYFESFMVIEPGLTKLKKKQLLSEEEYVKAQEQYGEDSFVASIGAEAIRDLLINLDLKAEKEKLRSILKEVKSKVAEERAIKRLNPGHLAKLKSQKQLIIELSVQKRMGCSVLGYLVQLKTMNVCVENIKE